MSLAPGPNLARTPATSTHKLAGEVVFLYAFDIAYELARTPIRELLGQPVAQFVPDASKKSPKQVFFYRPQMVRLPPIERFGPRGPLRIERSIKLLPVGAISVTVRIPFSVEQIEDLVCFHDLRFNDGSYLYDEVRDLAEQVRLELAPQAIRPVKTLGDEEAYTVFCIHAPLTDQEGQTVGAAEWFGANRRTVASLLTEEPDRKLSDQEADESSDKYYSYYDNDIVVVDWDAAVIVDEPRYFDEVLYVMELANVQLAELEAYDRILDDATEKSYRDLASRRFKSLRLNSTQRELREIRIDLARLQDELSNITKFFGDWHLARIYQGLATRFHLQDWQKAIDEKLRTLDELYQILRQDQMNSWMLLLEASIVALFVLDIVKSIW